MKFKEFATTPIEAIGPAPTKVCKSSRPDGDLPSSWLASCKARGLRSRSGKRSYKIGNKRVRVAGKKIKGKKYGGPLPAYD